MPLSEPHRYQKLCTLRTHEPSFSQEEILVSHERFSDMPLWIGQLAQIVPVRQGVNSRDFAKGAVADDGDEDGACDKHILIDTDGSVTMGYDIPVEQWRAYTFVVKDAPREIKEKDPNIRVSIAASIAAAFGFRAGMQIVVQLADIEQSVASHIELTFRDEYLSRGDMWRLATSELSERTVYKDQKLLFLGTIKATIKTVWIRGRSRMSGYFATDTKPIFRSESARYTLFIQMSKEMWEFDTDSAGEIMFNKVIHGFLPELFKKWMSINAHHLVSIILFARLEYQDKPGRPRTADGSQQHAHGRSTEYQDFYRVVVSDMASNDWINILDQLKREFKTFLQDISIQTQVGDDGSMKYIIAGSPCEAYKGNLLEAINMASSQFSRDYIDRDLVRTGISVVVVTAGSGYFEVRYDMLKLTTDILMGSGIGIDLVCLSPMPLHSVPLFVYRNPRVLHSTLPSTAAPSPSQSVGEHTPRQQESHLRKEFLTSFGKTSTEPKAGDWSYAMPHWVDVSYWKGETDERAMQMKRRTTVSELRKADDAGFQPRIRLYGLQMGGLMENEMTNISLPKSHTHPLHPWHRLRHQISGKPITKEIESRIRGDEQEWMTDYDDYVFRPQREKNEIEQSAQKRAHQSASDAGSRLSLGSHHQSGSDYERDINGARVGSYRPGTGFLDWKMKEKPDFLTPPNLARRKHSTASLVSNTTTGSSTSRTPSLKLLRQISFGGSPYKAPEPIVSADLIAAGVVKPVTFTRHDPHSAAAKSNTSSKITQQFRAALTRSTSSQAALPGLLGTVQEDSRESSLPIEIGASTVASAARLRVQHGRQASDEMLPSSVETVKDSKRSGAIADSAKDENLAGLAHLRRNLPYLSSSAEAPQVPSTVTLTRALSPWLNLINPCNPRREELDVNKQFTRWQHVFPKARRADVVKWKSLCYPASVPLTNAYFPTAGQLAEEYHENFYNITQDNDHDVAAMREHLVRELIAFRLAHGFQFVVGDAVAEFLGNNKSDLANVFDKSYMAQDGATIFMSVGNTIHQLLCGADGKVEIRRFRRKPTQEYEPFEGSNTVSYQPLIRTVLSREYRPRHTTFKNNQVEYNWNIIDNFIAGYSDDFSDALRFWRARFVLIPVDIPSRSRALSTVREDTDEEIRLEGIRRLTQLWQRHRILPAEERMAQSLNRRKDPNPLAIEYQTRDPSTVIAAGVDSALFTESETNMITPMGTHTTKSYELKALAEELQSDGGVKMLDRRWHWRLHYNCFVGLDMTNWLLLKFNDIETRDAAVDFGNRLMKEGLFVHVRSERDFRDGQYFYQMANEYRAPRPESRMGNWFLKSTLRSQPATPMIEGPRSSHILGGQSDSRGSDDTISDRPSTPTVGPERRKVYLSKVMRYDVDPRHKSYRQEIINLHYDRLHNPDNCYHIRIDWMNVTSKFIEDAIVNWATTVERYGLKLVEVPIAEAYAIIDEHPFRSPYPIKLAKSPPSASVSRYFETTSFVPVRRTDAFAYHKALLKKLNFVLDVEAASSFPFDVEVLYSWGKPDYKYTQYIHKAGVVLAQITDEGDFLLLANRLYSDRGSARRDAARVGILEREMDRRLVGHHGGNRRSPLASPAAKPIVEGNMQHEEKLRVMSAEEVKDEVERFCSNVEKLEEFYAWFSCVPAATNSPSVRPLIPELLQPPKRKVGLEIDVNAEQ